MDLSTSTNEALARTAALDAALGAGRLADCPELLELRGTAMAAFQAAHEAAPEAEKAACQAQIDALAAADAALRAAAGRERDAAQAAVRGRMGAPHRQRAYDNGTQACVDRKA